MKKAIFITAILLTPLFTNAQEIGLQLYSLRNQFEKDVASTLDSIVSWGITKLEYGGSSYGLSEEDFKKEIETRGMELVSVAASYEELRDKPEKVLERAKLFDTKYVVCFWIDHQDNNFGFEDARKAIEVFNNAGSFLKENGVTLAYHVHGYEFRPYEDGTLFDYMARYATHFDFEMDVYWVKHGGADPLSVLNTYPDKFILMHLKDMEMGVKGDYSGHSDVENNVILGTGQIDIAALVKRGKELGIKYMFIEDESSRVLKQVPKSLKYLESL